MKRALLGRCPSECRAFVVRSALLGMLLLAFGCVIPAAGSESEVLRIGIVAPSTGVLAEYFNGEAALEIVKELLEQVNSEGGVLGRPLVLEVRDSASDPATAFALTQELLRDASVVAVVGGVSPATARALEAAANGGELVITLAMAHDPDGLPDDHVSNLGLRQYQVAQLLAETVAELGYSEITVVMEDDSELMPLVDELREALASQPRSGSISTVLYDPLAANQAAMIAEVEASSGILLPLAYGEVAGEIVDILLARGIERSIVLWPYAIVSDVFAALGRHSHSQDMIGFQTTATPRNGLIDAVVLILAALRQTGNTDPEIVFPVLVELANPPGSTFFPTFVGSWGMEGKQVSQLDYYGLSGDVNLGTTPLRAGSISWFLDDWRIWPIRVVGVENAAIGFRVPLTGVGVGLRPPQQEPPTALAKTMMATIDVLNNIVSAGIEQMKLVAGMYYETGVILWEQFERLTDLTEGLMVCVALKGLNFAFGTGYGSIAGDTVEEIATMALDLAEKLAESAGDSIGKWIYQHFPAEFASCEEIYRTFDDAARAAAEVSNAIELQYRH